MIEVTFCGLLVPFQFHFYIKQTTNNAYYFIPKCMYFFIELFVLKIVREPTQIFACKYKKLYKQCTPCWLSMSNNNI